MISLVVLALLTLSPIRFFAAFHHQRLSLVRQRRRSWPPRPSGLGIIRNVQRTWRDHRLIRVTAGRFVRARLRDCSDAKVAHLMTVAVVADRRPRDRRPAHRVGLLGAAAGRVANDADFSINEAW